MVSQQGTSSERINKTEWYNWNNIFRYITLRNITTGENIRVNQTLLQTKEREKDRHVMTLQLFLSGLRKLAYYEQKHKV